MRSSWAPLAWSCGGAGSLAFAAIVGDFARYSWPTTVAVLVPASAAVASSLRLLQQPSFRTDSFGHPTISVLSDRYLASYPGRSFGSLL